MALLPTTDPKDLFHDVAGPKQPEPGWCGVKGLRRSFRVLRERFAQYLQSVPFPSQPRYDRKHRPLGLPKFNRIKTLPFCALICGRFAELAADGPTGNASIPVGLQEKAGTKKGSHSSPALPPAPHRWLKGMSRCKAGQRGHGWCSPFLPCLSCHHQSPQLL